MPSAAEKLQRHARMFYRSPAPDEVLERYSRKSEVMGGKELVRHMSHVCAWIALAQPLKDAAKRTRNDGLSPVLVLQKMLCLRGRAMLDDRARAALSAVLSSCTLMLRSGSCRRKRDWQKLRDLLPKSLPRNRDHMKELVAQSCHDQGGEERDIWMLKRVRRLNRRICKWENFEFNERQAYASELIRRFAETSSSDEMSSVHLRGLLYEVAAVVSCPRGKSARSDPREPLDDFAAERLRASALIQKELRRIMVQAIVLWRGRLRLEDEQIEPVLARMRYFIERFENRHGDLNLACEGRQWTKLKAAVGSTSTEPVTLLQPASCGQAAGKKRRMRTSSEGCYTPSERIRAFPCVKHRTSCAVRLFCATCQRSIVSDWYLEDATGKSYLLVPRRGHLIGRHKLCGLYRPKDSVIEKRDDTVRMLKKISQKMVRLGVSTLI